MQLFGHGKATSVLLDVETKTNCKQPDNEPVIDTAYVSVFKFRQLTGPGFNALAKIIPSQAGRIMKLTAILLLAACLQVSAKGYSQTVTLSVKNASLTEVFESIQKQTGCSFVYSPEIIKKANKVDLEVKGVSLDQVLTLIFSNQPFSYKIFGSNIITVKNKSETFDNIFQLIDIKGRVLNEIGEAVEGVSVTVKGSDKSTVTDVKGEFVLVTIDKDAILVFTHVSMESFELKVSGKTQLAISLKTKVSALGDVTVTVNTGYQQLPKERATGSFGFVNREDFNRKAGTDILSRLEGVTTGILIDRRQLQPTQNLVAPGNIMIRGISTLTEEIKSPLIIVDNFPYDGDINNINPNDVESITILKDAAAASIWGARAGNGVIVVTTKRSQFNQPFRLSLNTNVQITSKPDLFVYPRMSVEDYIGIEQFLFDQGFYDNNLSDPSYPALSPVVEIFSRKRDGTITQQEATAQINVLKGLDVRNDFDKYNYRTGMNNQYALNLTGGGAKATYFISGGLDRSASTLKGDDYRRITLRSTNNFMPVKGLDINVGLVYTNSLSENNSLGNIGAAKYNPRNLSLYPYAQFADEHGNALPIAKDYRLGFSDTAGGGKLLDWKFRPLDELRNSDNKSRLTDILLNLGASYRLNSLLSFSINYQFENAKVEARNLFSSETYYTRDLINLFTEIQGINVVNVIRRGGILDLDHTELVSHTGRAQININKNWNRVHEFTGLVGGEIRERKATLETQRFYGFDPDKYTNQSIDYVNLFPQYGNRGDRNIPDRGNLALSTDHFVSLYGNVAYSYKSKYTFSASARQDATNIFGVKANNRWKPLWTGGMAWAVHKESFYRSELFPLLRLRATFGYQGNVNNSISPNTIITYSITNNIANLPWAFITNAANPELAWESTGQLNIGLDFKIGQRITGTIEAYRKKSVNLLWTKPIDPTTGVLSVKSNNASMVSQGLEALMSSMNVNGNFQWNTEFGFTYNNSKITDYSSFLDKGVISSVLAASNGLSIVGRKGNDAYPMYSYSFLGLDPNTGDPLGYFGKNVSTDYQAILNQVYDSANLIYHGSSVPTFFGFVNNVFKYKGFSLLVNFSYKFGYYFKKNTISYFYLVNSGAQHYDYASRWQAPGDEKITTVPSFVYPQTSDFRDRFYAYSSANVLKGDNIRLQNIRLAYSLDKSNLKQLPFKSIQVYGNAENLGIIWRANKEGLDPDYNLGNAAFPVPKVFTLGLQVSL